MRDADIEIFEELDGKCVDVEADIGRLKGWAIARYNDERKIDVALVVAIRMLEEGSRDRPDYIGPLCAHCYSKAHLGIDCPHDHEEADSLRSLRREITDIVSHKTGRWPSFEAPA